MNRRPWVLLAIVLLLGLPLLAQDGSKDQIIGTDHDLTANPDTSALVADPNGNGQICSFCHIPHQLPTDNRVLLWNHQFGSTTLYTPYSSASLKATINQLNSTNSTQQKGEAFYSLACLSCHDGQTGVNVVYRRPDGYTGEGTPGAIGTASGNTMNDVDPSGMHTIGTDLSNDHPVNFTYNTALATADGGLYDPAGGTAISAGLRTVRAKTTDSHGAVTQPVLFNDTVQCATCHNPHSQTNAPYLRVDNASSALCLRCHSTT